MTKQEKIKKWLDENGYKPDSNFHFMYRNERYELGGYSAAHSSYIAEEFCKNKETPIGLITPENKWIPAPKFEDDIEAPVALPKQERGRRFEPDKFVPNGIRDVLMRFGCVCRIGYYMSKVWYLNNISGANVTVRDAGLSPIPFTWEEL